MILYAYNLYVILKCKDKNNELSIQNMIHYNINLYQKYQIKFITMVV